MKRLWLSLLLLAASVSMSLAQSPVTTYPYTTAIFNSSANVISTNTFQSIWAASTNLTGRTDCIIQNNGAASMYVYFGPIANATTSNSLTLAAAGIFRCGNSGVVTKDQISITGTSGQRFFAIQY